ncbi:MAG: WYL domain-containing protein, partial [Lachnospiraceae bacterium]|nr:WYL domain-containing protein [Lachnospiraceae bacterium]
FSLDTSLALWLKSNENIKDALSFFQMAGNFGIVGNYLLEQSDYENHIFRAKHSFFVHTLEDEVLSAVLNSIKEKTSVKLELKSSKTKTKNTADCIPLQIFTSTRSGRRFLCAYIRKSRRFTCYRLDTIQNLTTLEKVEDYDIILDKLNQNRQKLWGVSFQSGSRNHLDRLTMTLHVIEPHENYILDRLNREGRGGSITKINENVYQYETKVFDCNEMLPWIRTFIGRIRSLECTDKSVETLFYEDLKSMYQMYQISKTI